MGSNKNFIDSIHNIINEHDKNIHRDKTILGLKKAKESGKQLGRKITAKSLQDLAKGREACSTNADEWALEIKDLFTSILDEANGNLNEAARLLNASGVATRRGGKWHASSVKKVRDRLDNL